MEANKAVRTSRRWLLAGIAAAGALLGASSQAAAERAVTEMRGMAGARMQKDATLGQLQAERGTVRVDARDKQRVQRVAVRVHPRATMVESHTRKARPRRGQQVEVPELDAAVGTQAAALVLGSILLWPRVRSRRRT